jgi:hypothetical protein
VRCRPQPGRGAGEQGVARLAVCIWNIHGK